MITQLTDNITKEPSNKLDGFFFEKKKLSYLHLENGNSFSGTSPNWQEGPWEGEVVFNTGMTGYEATLTDPSYAGQILVFTYPLIGNYGVPLAEGWESKRIHAAGVVMSEACDYWSHGKGHCSILQWLQSQGIPAITGIDTRELTKMLREFGTMGGAISSSQSHSGSFSVPQPSPRDVSIPHRITYGSYQKKIIVVDCGMKENILRNLQKHPITICRVPYNDNYADEDFDGIFISNGPGDPTMYTETIAALRKAMVKKKPIFGICLGAQLLSLAAGAATYKLKYGHRGHNQPCIDLESGKCYLTSQNHGYAVEESSLPAGWVVSHRNLNDGTVEGIRHTTHPFSAVQFHPEAAPGPTDTEFMFTQFIDKL